METEIVGSGEGGWSTKGRRSCRRGGGDNCTWGKGGFSPTAFHRNRPSRPPPQTPRKIIVRTRLALHIFNPGPPYGLHRRSTRISAPKQKGNFQNPTPRPTGTAPHPPSPQTPRKIVLPRQPPPQIPPPTVPPVFSVVPTLRAAPTSPLSKPRSDKGRELNYFPTYPLGVCRI